MCALRGVIPILPTPFHDDASLDLESWQRLLEFMSQLDIDGITIFEQQPGVAVRKEILRRRGLIAWARVRHPGTTISRPVTQQLDALLARTLPELDITRHIPASAVLPSYADAKSPL